MGDKIRFAPIIRVSTEKQEYRGASLASQKRAIIKLFHSSMVGISLITAGFTLVKNMRRQTMKGKFSHS